MQDSANKREELGIYGEGALTAAVPDKKKFKPRFPDIPELQDYRAGGDDAFWSKFPGNWVDEVKPKFSHVALRALVAELGCSN